jgi:hypothetical protein
MKGLLQHQIVAWVRLPDGRIETVSWSPTVMDCRKGDVVHLEQYAGGGLRVSPKGCAV